MITVRKPPDRIRPGPMLRVKRVPRIVSRAELAMIFGSWSVYGVAQTGQRLAILAEVGQPTRLGEVLPWSLAGALVWAVLTIFVFGLSRRFPLDRKPRTLAIVVHALASPIVATIEVFFSLVIGLFTGWISPDASFMVTFWQGFPFNVVVYWLLAGVAHGFTFYRRYRQRDVEADRLAARLARAELDLLKSQLQPHFLFNTLTAISALMHRDVKAADRMVARLSELLRAALDHNAEEEVSLQEELAFLDAYVEIEQARLGTRLSVELDVQTNVLDARVPHMILQPLVENAIQHGIATRVAPGTVTISARGRRGMLDLEVRDDGPGVPPGTPVLDGVGLANTRTRLDKMYGDDYSFEPGNAPGGGFRVALAIPFRAIGVAGDEDREDDT
ncbi:MAG: histidine kinase [Gemmatimonadota bacterium]|jgi:signal transduction histidine kinase